jgi:hypothetical protein
MREQVLLSVAIIAKINAFAKKREQSLEKLPKAVQRKNAVNYFTGMPEGFWRLNKMLEV